MLRSALICLIFGIVSFQSSWAKPVVSSDGSKIDMVDPITIYADDGPHDSPHGPHRVSDGPDGHDRSSTTTLKGPSPADIARDQAKKMADEMRSTIDQAGEINLDILTHEIEGPGGSILWILWEVTKRALTPTDIGTHPIEDPNTFKFDAYRTERILRLRLELEEEAKKARNPSSLPEGAQDPATRTLLRISEHRDRSFR